MLYCCSGPNFLRQCRALLGFPQGRQGPASDESFHQVSTRQRQQEASGKAEGEGKLQVAVSLEISLE